MDQIKFSLIICTLGERITEFNRLIDSLEKQTYKSFEIVVVTQGNHNKILAILKQSSLTFSHIKSDKRGLSLARNLGLQQVSGAYVTISDDDCWYPSNSLENIYGHFSGKHQDIGVLCFKIYDPLSDLPYKKYRNKQQFLGIRDIGACSSIELFYKNNANNGKLRFDERFGLGAIYPSCEENIFLADLLAAGNKIFYIPEFCVYHKKKEPQKMSFTSLKMKTVYEMLIHVFGERKGKLLYMVFFAKHFSKIEDKGKSLFFLQRSNLNIQN